MDYSTGDRVVIVRAEGHSIGSTRIPLKDPYPKHIGKVGEITSIEPVEILLEDGTKLAGCECWWRKLAEGW